MHFSKPFLLSCLLAASAAGVSGCGDNTSPSLSQSTGEVEIFVADDPGNVTSIHVSVAGADFTGTIDTDLVQQTDHTWSGSVLDVPPGTGRTVTASAFDSGHTNTYAGSAANVTVTAGDETDVALTLIPVGDIGPGVNTPPAFVSLVYPSSILSTQTATLFATAADPDANTLLTYTWSVIQGGGTFSAATSSNQLPGVAVSTVYTPVSGFTGFAVIQVAVTDGTATTTTSFPLAIGASVDPTITFDTPPDTMITSVERQSLMPGGTTQINFTLTNPGQVWDPATMQVNTQWTDSCGGTFDTPSESIAIPTGSPASRTVTYTAPSSRPISLTSCQLALAITDSPGGGQMMLLVDTWIQPTMVMFLSSAAVTGGQFGGSVVAADAFCQSLADAPTAAVPAGTYRALISFDQISAKNRLVDAPYVRIDGTPIARSKAELYSLNLLGAIRVNENNAFNGVSAVYTGTNGDGSLGTNCQNWTSTAGDDTSTAGINATSANPNWTNSGTFTCSASLPIYCVQQPDLD